MKRFLIIAFSTVFAALLQLAASTNNYSQLQGKATRYFDNREWSNAQAMLQMMIAERPHVSDNYSRGIVVAAMRCDTTAEMDFLERALKVHIPFDTLFNNVEKISFSLGETHLYEQFLLRVPARHPWLRRAIEQRLLAYYCFRRNGDGMIDYSRRMLAGKPDDPRYMLIEAKGFLANGDYQQAMSAFQHIVELHPDNFDALLYLGLYHTGAERRAYLERAYRLNPTPYVASLLQTAKK